MLCVPSTFSPVEVSLPPRFYRALFTSFSPPLAPEDLSTSKHTCPYCSEQGMVVELSRDKVCLSVAWSRTGRKADLQRGLLRIPHAAG